MARSNGGCGGIDAELLVSGNTLTFNIFVNDENKPLPTKGYSGAVLIVSGSSRETVTLVRRTRSQPALPSP